MTQRPHFPFKFSICGMDELTTYCGSGVTHVLSMLDPGSPEPVVFQSFGKHKRLEMRFHDIIDEREGKIAPQKADIEHLLHFGRTVASEEPAAAYILAHCHAGLSRSTSAMVLLLAQARADINAHEIVDCIVKIRPNAWPNLRILEIGDAILERSGLLVSAARRQYDRVVRTNPEFGKTLVAVGRLRELPAIW